jgi:apolipoprotein N-acyltransferase
MGIGSQDVETDHVPRRAALPERPGSAAATDSGLVRALLRAGLVWLFLLVPALLSAGLLWLCYFPMNCGWLAWIALVPLLCLVRSPARAWRVYLAAWVGGLVLFFACVQWLRFADDRVLTEAIPFLKGGHLTWSSLAIYCSLYIPVAVFLLRRLDRRTGWPLTFTLPLVWTALELLRAHVMTGFAWYFLGHTQHEFLALIQVADLGGAYVVSFVVAAVNGLVFEWLFSRSSLRQALMLPERSGCCSLRTQTIGVVGLMAGVLTYGAVRLGQEDFRDGPVVALVQGNQPQSLRNANFASDEEIDRILRHSEDEFEKLSDEAATKNPDLIVWPETSYSKRWAQLPDGRPHPLSEDDAKYFVERWKTAVLLGANADNLLAEMDADGHVKYHQYNAALLLEPQPEPCVARYNKIHRVPFGEYLPLRDTVPAVKVLSPYGEHDYSIQPGQQLTRFPLGQYRFGVLICYEDSDPFLSRHYVHDGPALFDFLDSFLSGGMYGQVPAPADGSPNVDFLINISNDAWFLGSSEHDQHLAVCRFRAIECRRSVARAVNMGISAVIDGSGRIRKLPGDSWGESKSVSGVVTSAIPIDQRTSVYAMVGDWLPALCWLAILGGIVVGFYPQGSKTRPGASSPGGA